MTRPKPLLAPTTTDAEFDVVGIGEISVDTVARLSTWPGVGHKQAIDDIAELPGGQIATSTLGCARLGLHSALIGAVGRERTGRFALAPLVEAGVDVSGVRRVKGARTRSAHVYVRSADGERSILCHRDPGLTFRLGARRQGLIQRARLLMADTTDLDTTRAAIDCARAAGVPVMLDADGLFPGWESLLARVEFPVVSRHFADESGQSRDPRACLDVLAKLGAHGAVVTLGEHGAIGRFGDDVIEVPAYRVDVRDTTGAGDAFHAGFAWSLLRGLSAEAALRSACAVAALNCRGVGAQSGLPTAERARAMIDAGTS